MADRIQSDFEFGYGILPKNIMKNPNLNIQAKAIYAYLCVYAGNKGSAFPGAELIKFELGISKDTFYKYLKELKEKGYIEITKERDKGKFTHNVYYLKNPPCPKLSDTVSSDTIKPDTIKPDTNNNNINNNNINNNNINNSAFSNAQNEQADLLWKQYPLKKGKARAMKKIPKLIKEHGYEQMMRCIARYVKYVDLKRKTDFKDLKYQNADTFFTSGYMDYLDDVCEIEENIQKKKEKTTEFDFSFWEQGGNDING
ncbi:helix-turn-helix domain-containing protein [Clostridium haemolyticum]|uniref:helix-turn-helix domain-containing protein n=1 Tax=Clostridium haemolyticum TaxID=84025 RepID=UPI00068AA660|nr:helix-turn-helix domain-containing protein [Clostridium haemolyticum]